MQNEEDFNRGGFVARPRTDEMVEGEVEHKVGGKQRGKTKGCDTKRGKTKGCDTNNTKRGKTKGCDMNNTKRGETTARNKKRQMSIKGLLGTCHHIKKDVCV